VWAATGRKKPLEKEDAVAEQVGVVLRNRTALFVRPYPYVKLVEKLKFRVDGWEFVKDKYGHYELDKNPASSTFGEQIWVGWDGYIKMLKRDTLGSGLFLAMREQLEKEADCVFMIRDFRQPPKIKPMGVVSDRPYQMECLAQMLRVKSGGLVLNSTGTGKTYIAGMYFSRIDGQCVFIVDELTLLKQAQAELSKVLGEDVGQIGKGVFDPKRVTVATVQTMHLHRNDSKFRPWSSKLAVMVIDEVHLAMNRRNFQTVASINPLLVFGLTATLELRKTRVRLQAFNLCGPVIFEYALERGVQEGFLSPGLAVFVDFENDFQKTRGFFMGKAQKEYASAIVHNKKRLNLVCSLVREAIKRDKHVIVLVERLKHIELLHSSLSDVDHRVISGQKKVDERLSSKKQFEEGDVRLIITNKVFKKGIDIKIVDVIIDAAAMRSKNDAVQKYGRGVRMCEGKSGLLYFDISDKSPNGEGTHRFEMAARNRRAALKSRKIVSGRASYLMNPSYIFDRAELELKKLIDKLSVKEEAVA